MSTSGFDVTARLGTVLTAMVTPFKADGTLTLMDEVLTPDSSRFWPAESYQEGINPPSFDKQFVRDWLEQTLVDGKPWNKQAPAPALPADVIAHTAATYREALERLTALAVLGKPQPGEVARAGFFRVELKSLVEPCLGLWRDLASSDPDECFCITGLNRGLLRQELKGAPVGGDGLLRAPGHQIRPAQHAKPFAVTGFLFEPGRQLGDHRIDIGKILLGAGRRADGRCTSIG